MIVLIVCLSLALLNVSARNLFPTLVGEEVLDCKDLFFCFWGFVKSIRKLLLIFFLKVRHKKIFFRVLWRRTTTITMKYQETAAEIEKEILNLMKQREYIELLFYVVIIMLIRAEKIIVTIVNLLQSIEIFFCLIIIRKLRKKWFLILCSVVDKITMIFIFCLYFYNLLQQLKKKG